MKHTFIMFETYYMKHVQFKYISNILYFYMGGYKFEIEDAVDYDNKDEFATLVGKLLYLSNTTRIDIAYLVCRLCGYIKNPKEHHMELAKRILRYLIKTIDYSLIYKKSNSIYVYSDADFNSTKSISGGLSYFYGNLVNWYSKRQHYVSLSTCESEILAIRESVSEIVYMRNLARELSLSDLIESQSLIYSDSESAINSCLDGGHWSRNKHYIMRINFIRDYINKKYLKLRYTSTKNMLADCLTKVLGHTILFRLVSKILNCNDS